MVGNTCTLSLVIGTTVNQFCYNYITNSALVPEAICCCLQTSTCCYFYQGGEIICIETFVHKTSILFELYGAIIMYCQRLFLLFTDKQNCLHTLFFSGDLPATNYCLHTKFQVLWCYGFGSTALPTRLS